MKEISLENIQIEMQNRLGELIREGVISHKKHIYLFGLCRPSYLTRTILNQKGYRIHGYIDNDKQKVISINREQKGFTSKFLNGTSEIIPVGSVEDTLGTFDKDALVLISSNHYKQMIRQLEALGYQEEIHCFQVFDFHGETEFIKYVRGKKRLDIHDIHQVGVGIMKHLHDFCEENQIRYWLCGGSLLGAVRHKGFIPWDDDIDIFMPMKDYMRFIDLYKDSEQFLLVSPYKYPITDYNVMLSRLMDRRTVLRELEWPIRRIGGVCVDIWPLIGLPDDEMEREEFFAGYYELRKMMWEKFTLNGGSLEAAYETYPEQYGYLNRYDFDKAGFVGVMPTQYFENDCTTRNVYEKTLQVPFENLVLNIPAGYKEYLDRLYGRGWEELPPEGKRKTHHIYEVFWR